MVREAGLTIRPESGSSSPASILRSVVLPAPFGPHRPTRSPSPICHVTRSNSVRSPKDLVSSASWITERQFEGGSASFPPFLRRGHAECFGCRREHLGNAEWLGQVSRHT